MINPLLKANLNLYSVLRNIEDMVMLDHDMTQMIKNWNESIFFWVFGGPQGGLIFENGQCRFYKTFSKAPGIKLAFISPTHFNQMMDGKGFPIPIKGFTKLNFLMNDFQTVSKKLEYYLKPSPERLLDNTYLMINTQLTLYTAAYAAEELCSIDPIAKKAALQLNDGIVLMKILSDNQPAVHLTIENNQLRAAKGNIDHPTASMIFKNTTIANQFFNGLLDIFSSTATGDIQINGVIPMLDTLGLVLDRIPYYLT